MEMLNSTPDNATEFKSAPVDNSAEKLKLAVVEAILTENPGKVLSLKTDEGEYVLELDGGKVLVKNKGVIVGEVEETYLDGISTGEELGYVPLNSDGEKLTYTRSISEILLHKKTTEQEAN